MATGIQGIVRDRLVIRLLENLAATNTVAEGAAVDVLKERPLSTQFFDIGQVRTYLVDQGITDFVWPDDSWVEIYETAGSGTMTIASARVVHYSAASGKLFYPGPGLDASKGMLNNAAALGETGTDKLRHKELLLYPQHADGLQIELGTFGDASQRHNADWHIPIKRKEA